MPPTVFPDFSRPRLGDDAPLAQISHEQVQAAELEIAAEDGPHAFGFGLLTVIFRSLVS